MSDTAIIVEGLSKQYRLGGAQQPYQTLRDTLARAARAPFGKAGAVKAAAPAKRRRGDELMWALKDVSFEIKQGEVVGIIGRNGAGKSTLLKVLSRITEPTSGFAELHGRVGTLLEVGTGFHPELTGRENIQLSGAILGMNRREIAARFDEMVAFAEVEKFIDTPVKFYSTGMFLRLAFAVAAHLEPEILMVDEVLAVGDMAFQTKCLGKMGEAAKGGRTVLFVSHNMGAVRSLCEKGLVLHQGGVSYAGDISSSIETYFKLAGNMDDGQADRGPASGFGFGRIQLTSHRSATIEQGEPFEVATTLHVAEPVVGFSLYCIVNDMHQRKMFQKVEDSSVFGTGQSWQGKYRIKLRLPAMWLEPGLYSVHFKVFLRTQSQSARHVSDVFHLDVGGISSGCGSILSPEGTWSIDPAGEPDGGEPRESVLNSSLALG
ncbi:MAG TPA: ABC transporter ATP-binding protein [Bryobacteraceae bacterium]|nr:ABC transporter ATP-binding protein [Bryobacteraceae bacterium]